MVFIDFASLSLSHHLHNITKHSETLTLCSQAAKCFSLHDENMVLKKEDAVPFASIRIARKSTNETYSMQGLPDPWLLRCNSLCQDLHASWQYGTESMIPGDRPAGCLLHGMLPRLYRHCLGSSLPGEYSVGLLGLQVCTLFDTYPRPTDVSLLGACPALTMSMTRQGGLRVAGGCRCNYSVWTGHRYLQGHSMHTTSCMRFW